MNAVIKSKITSLSRAAGSSLLRGTFFNLRIGFIAALLGVLTVFFFRPGTTPDETVVFVLVPATVFLGLVRLLIAAVTRIDLPQYATQPEAHIRLLARIVLFGMLAVAVGIPSLFAYRALGLIWAVSLAFRLLLMLFAGTFLAALSVGVRLPVVYQVGVRFLKNNLQLRKGIIVLNH